MKVGWVGLGKLGLPCALAMERYGDVEVVGYDVNPEVAEVVASRNAEGRIEADLRDHLRTTELKVAESVGDVVAATDGLVFVAVQTPHDPEYGGEKPMPETRADFSYDALRRVAIELNIAAIGQNKQVTMVVISTALPGTMRREVLPLLSSYVNLVYNPFFIAMGTTIHDYISPEFVLVGVDPQHDPTDVVSFYRALFPEVPAHTMSLESAELTKVAYNTFISMKIVFANTMLEICEATDANVDDVTDALADATRRVVSPAYLRGGLGDGGACHPRDNIAMSWLAERLNLSCDPFEFVTRSREAQSGWLAEVVCDRAAAAELPVVILGKAYKPESDLTYGSPALLLRHDVEKIWRRDLVEQWDPFVDGPVMPNYPAVYVVATRHCQFKRLTFPDGSIVVDPHRYLDRATVERDGARLVRLGAGGSQQ